MVLAMGEAMIFVVDSDEAVGQCDDEDMRKLQALAANKNTEINQKTGKKDTQNAQNNQEGRKNLVIWNFLKI